MRQYAYWEPGPLTDDGPEWGVCLMDSLWGTAEFTTDGLGGYGLPDITAYVEPEARDEPDEYAGMVNFLSIVATFLVEFGRIPTPDETISFSYPDGDGYEHIQFCHEPIVYNDANAVPRGRTQTIGRVSIRYVNADPDE